MTKYSSRSTTNFRNLEALPPVRRSGFDKFYHSFSAEFWLAAASALVIFNWCLHPESVVSVFSMLIALALGGFMVVNTNSRLNKSIASFLNKYGKSGAWLTFLVAIVSITVFNYATSPSQALILTNTGVDQLKIVMGGATGPAALITTIITIFRVLFFLGFMWALYRAYEKYSQQAELLDVIQTPVILLFVVGLIDAAAALFLVAPA